MRRRHMDDRRNAWRTRVLTIIMVEVAPAMTSHSIRERLDELYRRLKALPRADSAEAALRQLCEELERVEDGLRAKSAAAERGLDLLRQRAPVVLAPMAVERVLYACTHTPSEVCRRL